MWFPLGRISLVSKCDTGKDVPYTFLIVIAHFHRDLGHFILVLITVIPPLGDTWGAVTLWSGTGTLYNGGSGALSSRFISAIPCHVVLDTSPNLFYTEKERTFTHQVSPGRWTWNYPRFLQGSPICICFIYEGILSKTGFPKKSLDSMRACPR